jgi:hypothetical protein
MLKNPLWKKVGKATARRISRVRIDPERNAADWRRVAAPSERLANFSPSVKRKSLKTRPRKIFSDSLKPAPHLVLREVRATGIKSAPRFVLP